MYSVIFSSSSSAVRLSVFARSGSTVAVHSRILGETILFAADSADVPSTDVAVYRASELAQLVGVSPDLLRAIHDAKNALDGEVI